MSAESQSPDVGSGKGRATGVALWIGIVAFLALSIALVRKEFFPPTVVDGPPVVTNLKGQVKEATLLGAWLTDSVRRDTLLVFSDYQCPYCAELHPRLLRAADRLGVAVRMRHLPLGNIHPFAYRLAMAAECARQQGQFRKASDVIFEARSRISDDFIAADLPRMLSIGSSAQYSSCIGEETAKATIALDVATAQKLGLQGTPALLYRGVIVSGSPDSIGVDALLAKE